MEYRFLEFQLSSRGFELRRNGHPIRVEPKPLRLLLHLLSRAPATVPAEEIMRAVWPHEIVTRSSLNRAVLLARQALGRHGKTVVQTVRGRGYRIGVSVDSSPVDSAEPRSEAREPFVGRKAIRDSLARDIDAALTGMPRVVLLAGEPGIGKTRTAALLCEHESLQAAEVAWGHCLESPGTPVLWPWRQVVRSLVQNRAADSVLMLMGPDADILGETYPELASVLSSYTATHRKANLTPDQERFRFIDAFARLLFTAAEERPLVVVIDDLHFADELSLAVWHYVARTAAHCSLLLVGAYRHVGSPRNPMLERVVSEAAMLPSAGTFATLEGLTLDEVGQLIERLTSQSFSSDFVRDVYERTAGNPLFVRGLTREMGDAEASRGLSHSIVGVVRSRLHLLDEVERTVLEVASLIGREFDAGIVSAAASLSINDCLSALDTAHQAGLVTASDDGVAWRFVHMLIAEIIRDNVAPGQRARYHLEIAQALEARTPHDPRSVTGLVAHHYQRALAVAHPTRVFEASLAAADQAADAHSFEEAGDHLEAGLRAVERGDSIDDRKRFSALIRIAQMRGLIGSRERRVEAGLRALEVARRLGPKAVVEAALVMHDVKERGLESPPPVHAALDEALAGLGDGPSPVRAHLLALKAHVNGHSDPSLARSLADEAVEMARGFGGKPLREALYVRYYLLGGPDFLNDRTATAHELVELMEGHATSESLVLAYVDSAGDRLICGDGDGSSFWRALAEAAAGPRPPPGMAWYIRNHDAGIALLRGELDHAEEISREVFELGQRIDQVRGAIARSAHLMKLAEYRGELESAADTVEAALVGMESANPPVPSWEVALLTSLAARYSAESGRRERARELIDRFASDGLRDIPRNFTWLVTLTNLAHACAASLYEERAEALEVEIGPFTHLHALIPGGVLYSGSLAGARARLLELMGRTQEARGAYETAIAAEGALGAAPYVAASRARLEGLAA